LLNKDWPRDLEREEKIKKNVITQVDSISDLAGSKLGKTSVKILESLFNLGSSYIIRIDRNDILLGDIMIIMSKNKEFKRVEEALLLSRLIGLGLSRRKAEILHNQSQALVTDIVKFLPDATFAIDNNNEVIIWNQAMETMTGILSENIIGVNDSSYTIPFYGEKRPHLLDLLDHEDFELESRYSNLKRGVASISAEAFCPNLNSNKGAWIYAKAGYLFDKQRNIRGKIEIIRDITEQKGIESAIKKSERKYANLFLKAPLGYQPSN